MPTHNNALLLHSERLLGFAHRDDIQTAFLPPNSGYRKRSLSGSWAPCQNRRTSTHRAGSLTR